MPTCSSKEFLALVGNLPNAHEICIGDEIGSRNLLEGFVQHCIGKNLCSHFCKMEANVGAIYNCMRKSIPVVIPMNEQHIITNKYHYGNGKQCPRENRVKTKLKSKTPQSLSAQSKYAII